MARMAYETLGKTGAWKHQATESQSMAKSRNFNSQTVEMKEFSVNMSPHEIAKGGELELLRSHIEVMGLSVKATDNSGATLLHAAAATNQANVLRYLLYSGVSMDAADNEGNTALHVATINGHIESVHVLLEGGASDTVLNKNEDAPLHAAIKCHNIECMRAFLQHTHINLLVEGYRKRTPLHVAAELDLVDIVQEISSAVLEVQEWKEKMHFQLCALDANNLTPIHLAARSGSANVLDYMMENCANHGDSSDAIMKFVAEENSTPMHAAVDAGHINVVRVLLKHGASPSASASGSSHAHTPPFHLACYQGRLEMVKVMVEHSGAGIIHSYTAPGQSPLHWAVRSIRGRQIVRYLLQQGADVTHCDLEGNTALYFAIIYGSREVTVELLKACKDQVGAVNNIGQNVLHHAILNNRLAILLDLLKIPNARDAMFQKDATGMSPLHYALNSGHDDLVSPLLDAASTYLSNCKDKNGSNYLHLAASSGNWKAINSLLATQTGLLMLNEVNHGGATPLHLAAGHGHLSCVKLLLNNGAMIYRCHCGYAPFLFAVQSNHVECAQILYEAHPFQREWANVDGSNALHISVVGGSPEMLKLCLDLNIPITHNEKGETFLDLIIGTNNVLAALVVAEHSRWQECLDFPVIGDQKHPFIRLIECMPEVANEILLKCIENSELSPSSPGYFQKYNFKYLRLMPEDIEETSSDDVSVEESSKAMLSEAKHLTSITNGGEDREVVSNVIKKQRNYTEGMEALQMMLKYSCINLLTHPVVVYYLKMKWQTYGRLIYGINFLLFFLQVIFLSAFILVTPPTRLNLTKDFVVISDDTMLTSINTSSTVLRIITLVLCVINTIAWAGIVRHTGISLLSIREHDLKWIFGFTMISTYAFLIPWKYHISGFEFIFWEAGAIAVFLSWVTLILFIKLYDYFGLYVTMFVEVLFSLVKVFFIFILFLIAFSMTFFILVGDAFPFKFMKDIYFIMFSYLLSEINYEYYVERSNKDAIQSPVLTYLFVILAATLLAVVMMNLLIGLAVGDIEHMKKNAIVRQRALKISYFAVIDLCVPKFIQRHVCIRPRFATIYPNKRVSKLRAVWQQIWQTLEDAQDKDIQDIYNLLHDQDSKIQVLQHQLALMTANQTQQQEELKHLISMNITKYPKEGSSPTLQDDALSQ